jgi:hypothetical protein
MMFERFTSQGRQVVVQAQHSARRFGHNYIGPEHLFLSLVAADDPASALLRDLGLTPERTEAEFIRLTHSKPVGPPGSKAPLPASLDPQASPLAGLDAEALAAIGIDLDEVRTRIEATFGPGALSRAVPPHQRGRNGRRAAGSCTVVGVVPDVLVRTPGPSPRAATSRSPRGPRRSSSCRCARRSGWATTTSASSTSRWP